MNCPRVKICGVTSVRDAELAVGLGADFLGFNFYEPSPRYVDIDRARQIALAVGDRVQLVGVFVDAAAARVAEVDREAGLDLLQFHGDESRDQLEPFLARAIKVFRLGAPPAPDMLDDWAGAWGYLIEGRHEALYGGTGEGWAYEMIASLSQRGRIFVAGGLGPDNVRAAVGKSGAWGVDVCSGVESTPGMKSEALMRTFFDEVQRVGG